MTRATIAGGAFATVLVLLAATAGYRALRQDDADSAAAPSPAIPSSTPPPAAHPPAESPAGFLYGRITTVDGATYEGRLRWGENGGQEAFWSDYFNGTRRENPWAAYVPAERLPRERRPVEVFGFEIIKRENPIELGRQFMVPFGEVARIEARGREVRATLKNGAAFDLDRLGASDFDDGVRVWDGKRGVVGLDSLRVRRIELLPTPPLGGVPYRLYGTVRTRQGAFTGFVGWNQEDSVGTDQLDGYTADGELGVRFDTVRSIARRSRDRSLATLLDGREIELDGSEAGHGNRGIYVADRRYGRVLISWDAFERVDFSSGGSGPAYGDFPPGSPLAGSVVTRDGGRLAGRLVFDLDESATTDTLDAPFQGVDYNIPFGLIASIVPSGHAERGVERATVTLHAGEELRLERDGDLREANAGLLVFTDGRQNPEYVPWAEVERVEFARR